MKIKSVKYKKGEWYYVLEDDSLQKIEYDSKIAKDWAKINKDFEKVNKDMWSTKND